MKRRVASGAGGAADARPPAENMVDMRLYVSRADEEVEDDDDDEALLLLLLLLLCSARFKSVKYSVMRSFDSWRPSSVSALQRVA